ncbi:acetyl-CoA carboxylase carboxyltransferase subunit alpha [Granulibacter bethesdensis]|uniref:Acetyl-coenzyme A carboxylase carboxyl transferase subunit alpha n=2 Tax=Granulibacter bethesdensis TaxID=364410 RepID=Q0BUI6_GRABC|nr:acetyl-CoA carboxylase carboxyltransferase subunit alpha [Granulibacter bethesdensis]AHJ65027.1 Acetyl-coenzyme A carboxylase carboxyl transferase subunit alpha [Granulibacter bethesdensis CGDNIH4]ABI61516.1 Acetyl-coenzyme A carboxylase carboxyl transferase subunit alpha [Granulibacter bethesdensis CGDNIH1]AHJ67650.1 Acetyl-coenzyme A carboxylase carboxyl transferase subunit alpha [Granulibacter bethesdensis]APH51314.1 Acetyl-coenzyme A carboxylase carboxyl transferase subunit alpha [Granul
MAAKAPAMTRHFLEFEKPIAELEGKIEELRRMSEPDGINIADEVSRLTDKADKLLRTTYAKLTPWQKVQVARHPERPKAKDYITTLISDYTELSGDRAFADDAAIIGGLGRFQGHPVMVLGTEKGTDLETRIKHNFGSPRPEGYRKARRLVELAGRFRLPVLTFVDTAGAYPGVDAEARGQAEAIARSVEALLDSPSPVIATVIGEGGSGGAIALASADRVLMLEHAWYSVISPEACGSILWRDAAQASLAAETMKITADDLLKFGLIDQVVHEPLGGAHRAPDKAIALTGEAIAAQLQPLLGLEAAALKAKRREKFLRMGRDTVTH